MREWIARWVACALCVLAGCDCGSEMTERDGATPDADSAIADAGGDGPDGRPPPPPPPPTCDVGEGCVSTRGCRASPTCIDEYPFEIGGSGDEITGCAGGVASVDAVGFAGGYCSTVAAVDEGGCDPDDEDACGPCGACLDSGETSTTGSPITLCTQTCAPSLEGNPCRDGYECDFGSEVCLPGCRTDLECQVRRVDTNADGVIDAYDADTNPDGDRLACETEVHAYCDPVTSRCRHDGTPGAEAGARCTVDFDCEADGDCLVDDGTPGAFTGGYCTKLGCDVPGNGCAGDGKCQSRGLGLAACVSPCEVAASEPPGDAFGASRDCRAGYGCFWDGASGAGPANGGCLPANLNDVRTPNIGAACEAAGECYSPFGLGACRDFGAGGQCTLFDCAAPGAPADVCGPAAVCAQVSASATSLCLATCEAAEDCVDGNGCWDTGAAGILTGDARVCFPGCLETGDCRATERCERETASSVGECVPS